MSEAEKLIAEARAIQDAILDLRIVCTKLIDLAEEIGGI